MQALVFAVLHGGTFNILYHGDDDNREKKDDNDYPIATCAILSVNNTNILEKKYFFRHCFPDYHATMGGQ